MNPVQLTDTQREILNRATAGPDGRLDWFPDHLDRFARARIIGALYNRELVAPRGAEWFATPAAYKAFGREQMTPAAALGAAQIDTLLTLIAQTHLGIETLDERKSDHLDFHDLGVWSLRVALEAAFMAGVELGASVRSARKS